MSDRGQVAQPGAPEQLGGPAEEPIGAVVVTESEVGQYLMLLADVAAGRSVVDGRHVLDAATWKAAGWEYRALGRGSSATNGVPGGTDGRPPGSLCQSFVVTVLRRAEHPKTRGAG